MPGDVIDLSAVSTYKTPTMQQKQGGMIWFNSRWEIKVQYLTGMAGGHIRQIPQDSLWVS
jgi:hypothetical protein